MPTFRDGNGNEIVYVRKKPTTEDPTYGPPSPCLVTHIGYAIGNGYEECAPPGESQPEVVTVAPEPVAGEDEPVSTIDNSSAIVEPEQDEDSPSERSPRKRK